MEKLTEILQELEQGKISAAHAERGILRLFDSELSQLLLADFVKWQKRYKNSRCYIDPFSYKTYLKVKQSLFSCSTTI